MYKPWERLLVNGYGVITPRTWVAVAVGGTAVVGAVGANMAANTSANAAGEASQATKESAANQIASQERMYNQGRDDFAPFRNLAPRSLATLESSIYGTPQSYADPSFQPLSDTEAAQQLYGKIQSGEVPVNNDFWKDINNGENPLNRIMRDTNLATMTQGYSKGADGKIIKQSDIPQLQANGQQFDLANFRPENTAAYDWQKSRTLEGLGNYFNLTGRGRGSTVQSNATGRALGDLNAAEYDKGYNRLFQRKQDYTNDLLNLVKTAQGAAGSTSSLGQNAANQTGQAYQNQGNSLANIAQQSGQTQANLYAGIVPSTMNTIGTGLQAAQYFNNSPSAPVYKSNGEFI